MQQHAEMFADLGLLGFVTTFGWLSADATRASRTKRSIPQDSVSGRRPDQTFVRLSPKAQK
jgi:hypothetical protein